MGNAQSWTQVDIESVKKLVEQGANIGAKIIAEYRGRTELMLAAQNGHLGAAKCLVNQGADKEAKDNDGRTALMLTAHEGHLDVVKYLVDQGADKEAKDNDGRTALMLTAHEGHLNVMKYLVEQSAGVETKNDDGRTALMFAARKGHLDVVKYLVKQGANIGAKNDDGRTALLLAAVKGRLDMAKYLVEQGADASILDNDGNSCLIHLLDRSEPGEEDQIRSIVKLMLERGAPPLVSNNNGISAKPIAITKGFHHVVALIEEYDAKPKPRQNEPEPEIPNWYISPDKVIKPDVAQADGGFGTVFRAIWMETNVAMKEIKITSKDNRKQFLAEVTLWRDLRHDYVVPFYGANHLEQPFFILSKFAEEGTLCAYLEKENRRKEVVWRKLYEVAVGLNYLHKKNVIHGDLKGNNIVVDKHGTAMLTDFGLSFLDGGRCLEDNSTLGAMRWRGPEYERNSKTNPSTESDVYSLGMCIIEAVTGGSPWPDEVDYQTIRSYRQGEAVIEELSGMTSDQWELVKSMTNYARKDRPNMDTVLQKLSDFVIDEECPL